MVRKLGLKEGIWQVLVNFGLGATNAGPTEDQLSPAALVAVLNVGLQKAEKVTNLTVDAGRLEASRESQPAPRRSRGRVREGGA